MPRPSVHPSGRPIVRPSVGPSARPIARPIVRPSDRTGERSPVRPIVLFPSRYEDDYTEALSTFRAIPKMEIQVAETSADKFIAHMAPLIGTGEFRVCGISALHLFVSPRVARMQGLLEGKATHDSMDAGRSITDASTLSKGIAKMLYDCGLSLSEDYASVAAILDDVDRRGIDASVDLAMSSGNTRKAALEVAFELSDASVLENLVKDCPLGPQEKQRMKAKDWAAGPKGMKFVCAYEDSCEREDEHQELLSVLGIQDDLVPLDADEIARKTHIEKKFAALTLCQVVYKEYEDDKAKQDAFSQCKALFGDSGLHPELMSLLD